jgi:hypothetical protein
MAVGFALAAGVVAVLLPRDTAASTAAAPASAT